MYSVRPASKFQKDLKRIQKRGYNIDLLTAVIKKLASGETLDAVYRDHPLGGNNVRRRECHITPDWLLIYEISEGQLIFISHPHRYSQRFIWLTESGSVIVEIGVYPSFTGFSDLTLKFLGSGRNR
ncbi:mRNA interferase YafQ [Oxobacter pfennigii]|uniref:mRNA interferase YafQ n=1 Tax=Oxobacter pfennigii TaxID=36849 RepID=A0A0P9AKP1_9CLOT|nr:mRNA interferase YafQ [Oxobacter pfennigii]